MADTGKTIGLIKALASVDPEVIQSSVEGWLDDHPEATTTVQDGSITKQKLDQNLQQTVDDVGDLKSIVSENGKGFSSSSARLLKTILNSIVYTSDQSQNITDLYNALIKTKTVQLTPIKSNMPNSTTFAYEPKSWQTSLVWEPDYTITGGVMTVTFDDEVVTNFDIQVYLLDASKQPYKYFGYKNPENYNIEGEWTPYWYDPGVNAGFANAKKTFSLSIPEGCYAFFCVRWNNTVYGGAEVTDAATAANWVINDDGITVVISGGIEV